jgi:hypothetical protein
MMGWEGGETTGYCFIIALAKVHPLFFFSFRLCQALAFCSMSIAIFEGYRVLSDALRSTGHAAY